MNFEIIFNKYEETFGKNPPMLVTLSPNDKKYQELLINAIEEKEEITLNDLAEIFMTEDEVLY